jgi:flavin reductase ActVB
MAVAPAEFREALKDFPGGVTIVTAGDPAGTLFGATVSAFASLSLEPPLVLVCLKQDSGSVGAIRRQKAFAVHVLDAGKAELARRFADNSLDKFAGVNFSLNGQGVPCLVDCTSRIECDLYNELPGGDHVILVGLVTSASNGGEFEPLVYAKRHFYALGRVVD